jgi:Flp pilus assembly protein CpaB
MLAAGPIPQGTIIQPVMLQTQEEQMKESQLGQLVEPGYVAIAFPISELSSVSYGAMPGDYVDVLVTFAFIDVDTDSQSRMPICPEPCPTGAAEATSAEIVQLPRLATQLTLQKIQVLGVGRWAYQPPPPEEGQQTGADTAAGAAMEPPQFITLMLTPQDALVLKWARESNAAIELAVRQRDDTQDFATQQVTLDYLLARFSMSLPAKREYTIQTLPPQ